MQIPKGSFLVKPITAYFTKESSESSAGPKAGTEIELRSWEEFYSFVIGAPIIVTEKDLQAIEGKRRPKKRTLCGYSLATYDDRHRKKSHIKYVYAVGIDIDTSTLSPEELAAALKTIPFACFWHTTLSHGLDNKPRYRVVYPLARPCHRLELDAWEFTRDKITTRLKALGASRDESAKDPSRFWFWPACVKRDDYRAGIIDGELLPLYERPKGIKSADDEPPPTDRSPSTLAHKENTHSMSVFSSSVKSTLYDLTWVSRQMEPYLKIEKGQRGAWIGPKVKTLAGIYAGGGFDRTLSEWMIIDTIVAYVMRNSSRTEQEEARFVKGAWDSGKALPLESKKKAKTVKATSTEKIAERPKSNPEAPRAHWESQLLRKDGNAVKNMQFNINLMLEHHEDLKGIFCYDAYADETIVTKRIPGAKSAALVDKYPRVLRDEDYAVFGAWCEIKYGFSPSDTFAIQGIRQEARKNAYHPIKEYLDGLKVKNSQDTLSTFLIRLFGLEDALYTRAIARKTLISAVARIYEPGCKVDTMLVLEGEQGVQKSTAISILFSPWFSDNLSDIHTKDACIDLRGHWAVEVGELHKFKNADIETLKAFLSRQVDKFRPPYGREVVQYPRQGILIGTTNKCQYLADESGGRRFWPAACRGEVKTAQLKLERDELWAQAVAAYKSGEPWWMETKELEAAAKTAQEDRYVSDIWMEKIEPYLRDKEIVSLEELAKHVGLDMVGRQTRADGARITDCLRFLGWERFKTRDKGFNVYRFRRLASGA